MFGGVYPIVYAFFDSAGELERAAMRRRIETCVRNPSDGNATLAASACGGDRARCFAGVLGALD